MHFDENDYAEEFFIDALDEQRDKRDDKTTNKEIVKIIKKIKPEKVRLACRLSDWQGNVDVLLRYFKSSGGYIVIVLKPLELEEQTAILVNQEVTNPESFLSEAISRGLEFFITNPQNLIMLSNVVEKNKVWPETRKTLFQEATTILLKETNHMHRSSEIGCFSADELCDTAGAICAAYLISGIEGINLAGDSEDPRYPSYRACLTLQQDENKINAVLRRRVFSGMKKNVVTYCHRTIAEYLGAQWLAKQISDNGFQIELAQSLFGTFGYPASELRGLYSWLTVFLSATDASLLIDKDPYGILIYGDAASLDFTKRKHLLASLNNLSEKDPGFRKNNWNFTNLGSLADQDLISDFKVILSSFNIKDAFKSLILDILIAGKPLPELQEQLQILLLNEKENEHIRSRALTALINIQTVAKNNIKLIYQKLSQQNTINLKFRIEILAESYSGNFDCDDILNLLKDIFNYKGFLTTNYLEKLPKNLTVADSINIFEYLVANEALCVQLDKLNSYSILNMLDQILITLIKAKEQITRDKFWQWLVIRNIISASDEIGLHDKLKNILANDKKFLLSLIDSAIDSLVLDGNQIYFIYNEQLNAILLYSFDSIELLNYIYDRIFQKTDYIGKLKFLYAIAFNLAFRINPVPIITFEKLYRFADDNPAFATIRDQCCSSSLESDSYIYRQQKRQTEQKQKEQKTELLKNFDQQQELISKGKDQYWLTQITAIYFLNAQEYKNLSFHARLQREFGVERARIAIEGLISCLQNIDIPSVKQIATLRAKNEYHEWWLVILAGLNEYWLKHHSLSDKLLEFGLAIDLTGLICIKQNDWKINALKNNAVLVCKVYKDVVKTLLVHHSHSTSELNELLTNKIFALSRAEIAIELLTEFPNALPRQLEILFRAVIGVAEQHDLLKIVDIVLKRDLDTDRKEIWLTAAFLIASQQFKKLLEESILANLDSIWFLRDMIGYNHELNLEPNQLAWVISIFGQHYPANSFSGVSWEGDKNPRDASKFITYLINQLSINCSETAELELKILIENTKLVSYRDLLKHELENYYINQRKSKYSQPDWSKTLKVLVNKTPINSEGLHILLLSNLNDLKAKIKTTNSDMYLDYWNLKGNNLITDPRPENYCRNLIRKYLCSKLQSKNIIIEPESQMAAKKVADIVATFKCKGETMKAFIEVKRDYNRTVWTGLMDQADKYYASNIETGGFGIYCVIWFGDKRPEYIPRLKNKEKPDSADKMQEMLQTLIPLEKQHLLRVIVIDVSEPYK